MNNKAYVVHRNNENPIDKITRYGWTKRNEPGELLGIAEMIHPQPGEEWAIQNVRIGLQSLIAKLEEGVR